MEGIEQSRGRPTWRTLAVCVAMALAGPSWGADLFASNSAFNGMDIRSIDPETGGGSVLWTTPDPPRGLAARPGEPDFLYYGSEVSAVLPGPLFVNTPRLEKIEIATGVRTAYPDITAADLGLPADYVHLLIKGLSISPDDPDTVVVALSALVGDLISMPPHTFLMFLDADTGLEVAPEIESISLFTVTSLAFSLDGSTLYAGRQRRLATVDTATGAVTNISMADLPEDLAGIAFDPDDATLFGVIAGLADELVTISIADGTIESTRGFTGALGPTGLAFVPFSAPPVPAAGVPVVLALFASIALAGRRALKAHRGA